MKGAIIWQKHAAGREMFGGEPLWMSGQRGANITMCAVPEGLLLLKSLNGLYNTERLSLFLEDPYD